MPITITLMMTTLMFHFHKFQLLNSMICARIHASLWKRYACFIDILQYKCLNLLPTITRSVPDHIPRAGIEQASNWSRQ